MQLRVRETERAIGDLARRGELAAVQGDERLWDALESHKADFQAFRGQVLSDMVTKTDLRATEQRILEAFDPRRTGPRV